MLSICFIVNNYEKQAKKDKRYIFGDIWYYFMMCLLICLILKTIKFEILGKWSVNKLWITLWINGLFFA